MLRTQKQLLNYLSKNSLLKQQPFIYSNNFIQNQPKYTYFSQYLGDFECRKEIVQENKKINEKIVRIRMPFYEKYYDQVKKNKKKFIFFIFILFLCQYNDLYTKYMIWYKYRETFSQKIQRWCFSKDYRVPESIQEQRFDKLHLKPETIDKLSVFYQKNDKILQLGITRKYLCRVYKDLGLFTKPDDKFGFYQFSGYGKKRNQQKASVNLYQFLHLFNEALKKQNYIESKNENYITKFLNKLSGKKYVSEDEFCLKFLQALENNLESMKQWEIGNIQKQVQYKNFGIQMKEQKNKIIQETLTSEPMVKLEDINKELSKHGFLQLNAKEKIVILHRQKAYLILHENNFKEKLENSLDSSKQFKYKQRMEEINEKLKTINSQIDLYSKQFKELFPGQKVFLYEKDQEEEQKQEK